MYQSRTRLDVASPGLMPVAMCSLSAFGIRLLRQASVHPSLTGCTVSMQGHPAVDMNMFGRGHKL